MYGCSEDGHASLAIIINLARSLPLSLRACGGVSSSLYVTAVNVSDPSAVPPNDPYSRRALGPNIAQSLKARSPFPIFTVSVPSMCANRIPCLLPRLVPQAVVLITRRLGDFVPKTMVNDYPCPFSSHPISQIPTVVQTAPLMDGRDGCQ